jgi:hypothetical protein
VLDSQLCVAVLDSQLCILCDQCAADVHRYQSGRCIERVSPNERSRAMVGVSAGGVLCTGVWQQYQGDIGSGACMMHSDTVQCLCGTE